MHIDIEQTATGGLKGTTELRTLDDQKRSHEDHLFGLVTGHTKWVDLATFEEDPYLKEGWLDGEEEKSAGPNGEKFIQSFVVNEARGWDGDQVWGFADINGERRYTRRVIVTKGKEVMKIRMIYDFRGRK